MSVHSTKPARRTWQSIGAVLFGASVAAAVVALIVAYSGAEVPPPPSGPPTQVEAAPVRVLPLPPQAEPVAHVIPNEFEGQPVLSIKTAAEGDEMLVDADSGRLVAVRDAEGRVTRLPTAPAQQLR